MKTISLTDISRDERYRLSFPLNPRQYGEMARRLPGLPLLILDRRRRLVAGHDYAVYLRNRGRRKATALGIDLAEKEALFFAGEWKLLLAGFNLYEKLVFLKKALPLAAPREILRRLPLGIPFSESLRQNLDRLLRSPFKKNLMAGTISVKILLRVLDARNDDQRALARLLAATVFNENQQQKILEMLEEIAFRDRLTWKQVFARISLPALEKREMPQKSIIDALLRLRFPQHQAFLRRWQAESKAAFAAAGIQLTPPPFFESKEVVLTLRCPDMDLALHVLAALKNSRKR